MLQFDNADITDLEVFRKSMQKEASQKNTKVTLLAFVIKAIVSASNELSNINFTKIIFPINQFVNKLITEQAATAYLVRALVDQGYIINSLKTQNKLKPTNFQVYLHTNKPATKEI